jgi:hypothetical protein
MATFQPHPDDRSWWKRFTDSLRLLDDAPQEGEQLAVIQRDDITVKPGQKYVPCPRRGTHTRLTECHMCWCDVAWGYAKAKDVLRSKTKR